MIEIKHKDWSDISINQYYEIVDICEDESKSEMEKNLACCAVICDCTEDDIYSLPITEARELVKGLGFMNRFEFNHNFSKTHIKINEEKYTIDTILQNMTVAQYIDFQEFWGKKDLRKYYGNILACFIIPEGKKYNEGYDVIELAEIFRDSISIKLANEVLSFFVNSCLLSIEVMKMYSTWMVKKMAKKTKNQEAKKQMEQKIKELEALYGYLS